MLLFVLEPEISATEVLKGLGEIFDLAPGEHARERLTYLDTFDWRLHEAELTLTVSSHGRGVRLALLADDQRSWEARAPRIPHFGRDLPPGPFREALESVSSIRRLLPKARVRWDVEEFALLNEDDKTVVRVRIRKGQAALPDTRETGSVATRLELVPLKGYEGELKKALTVLRRTFHLKPQDRRELWVVLEALGRAPGDYSSSFKLDLDPDLRSHEAVRAIHRCLLDTMEANQEGMIQDLDPEFLHDFRVAIRRTRSALAQVPGVFPEAVVQHFEEEFRWLGERTGPTRDMDVYLLKIPGYRKALPEDARDHLEPLVRFLSKKKRLEHQRMVRSLGSKRYGRLVDEWRAFLQAPAERDTDSHVRNAARPIGTVAAERIWKSYRKVLKRGRKIDRKTSPETLHRLRIDCKKLRYLMTFFQSLFPTKALKPLIKEVKSLQDNLGDFNDLYVQRAALLGFAGEMMATEAAPPATLMAMGQLMGQLEASQSVEGEAFRARFEHFAREKNQERFRRLFDGKKDEAPQESVSAPAPEEAAPRAPNLTADAEAETGDAGRPPDPGPAEAETGDAGRAPPDPERGEAAP